MPGARLTAENVRSLRPRTGRARDVYFDKAKGAPPGFALRVTSNGARSYVYVYRSPLRTAVAPKVFLNLGDADHVSLADARKELTACLRTGRAQRRPRMRIERSGAGRLQNMLLISDRPPEIALGTLRLLAHWAAQGGGVKVTEDELIAEIRSVGADEWEQTVADAERELHDAQHAPSQPTES